MEVTAAGLNNFLGYLNAVVTLIPIALGISYWSKTKNTTRAFTLFLVYGLFMTLASMVFFLQKINNMILFNLDTLITYVVLAMIFSRWHRGFLRTVIWLSAPIYFVIFGILFLYGFENSSTPGTYSAVLSNILLSVWSVATIYVSGQEDSHPVALMSFWFSAGVLLSFGSSIFIYAGIPGMITSEIWVIYQILVLISYLVYSTGFMWLRNSTTF